ncbi:GtrA family protein [Endothiovibrio diazotrophicus]
MRIALAYALFALLATGANIAAQDLSIRLYYGAYGVLLSVIVGTGVGLVLKYVLDKKYIFKVKTAGLADDGRKFILYTAAGLVTTLIFWGFEFGFHWFFESKGYRYLGGVIGLAIGYWIKYHLDKRYTFAVQ